MTQNIRQVPELKLSDYLGQDPKLRRQFVEQLFLGLKEYGFIILKEHSISVSLLEKAYGLAEELFSLPDSSKRAYAIPDKGFQRGYTPFGKEHAKDAPVADLKEFWHIGRELEKNHRYYEEYPENIWPKELNEFQQTFLKIYSELDQCGDILLEALSGPLEVDKDYFRNMTRDGNSILRLLHYPPLPPERDPRSIRAAAHEDINLITLLVSASASGLELKDRDGQWLTIDSDPNSIIVDSGDMLARLTNDVIPSTTHRVVNPPDDNTHRYSMPFFMHPNPEAILSCLPSCRGAGPKYPDIRAQDFLYQRLREIGLS